MCLSSLINFCCVDVEGETSDTGGLFHLWCEILINIVILVQIVKLLFGIMKENFKLCMLIQSL